MRAFQALRSRFDSGASLQKQKKEGPDMIRAFYSWGEWVVVVVNS